MRGIWIFAIAVLGCAAGQPAPVTTSPSTEKSPSALPSLGVSPLASSAIASSSSANVPATPTAAPGASASHPAEAPGHRFPPPSVTPPYPRSAGKNDGEWTPFPAGSPFAKTVIHPHETSRFIEVTIVAIDLTTVTLGYMPGTDDLGGKKVPFTPGLVPKSEQERLLAVFNGGFQPRHGHWGMKLGDEVVVPPRDEGCTLSLYADGTVRLQSWPALSSTAAQIRAYRQTPPCLLEAGVVHPDLVAGRDKAWAGQNKDLVTRRRSAAGLDASGSVLFYAIGVEAPPRLLAEALRAAGAESAAELDINWNWTRFLLFTKDRDGKLRATTALAEGDYAKSGYVERPSERDFFYVLRR